MTTIYLKTFYRVEDNPPGRWYGKRKQCALSEINYPLGGPSHIDVNHLLYFKNFVITHNTNNTVTKCLESSSVGMCMTMRNSSKRYVFNKPFSTSLPVRVVAYVMVETLFRVRKVSVDGHLHFLKRTRG